MEITLGNVLVASIIASVLVSAVATTLLDFAVKPWLEIRKDRFIEEARGRRELQRRLAQFVGFSARLAVVRAWRSEDPESADPGVSLGQQLRDLVEALGRTHPDWRQIQLLDDILIQSFGAASVLADRLEAQHDVPDALWADYFADTVHIDAVLHYLEEPKRRVLERRRLRRFLVQVRTEHLGL